MVWGGSVREGAGPSVRAPSIRGVFTSAVFMKTWFVSMALEAASWRSNSIFASFSLRGIQYVFEGLRSLGPVVAAGSVLQLKLGFCLARANVSASAGFSASFLFPLYSFVFSAFYFV